MSPSWLSLSDYSVRYGVSVSTLRRRIRSGKLPHKMISGRYFVLNIEPDNQTQAPHSSEAPSHNINVTTTLDSALYIISELKRVYTQSLQEKESYILQLKDQLQNVQNLLLNLELENHQLKELLFNSLSLPSLSSSSSSSPPMPTRALELGEGGKGV